jgi:hypothetical protein
LAQFIESSVQALNKCLVIDGGIAIMEDESAFGLREGFKVSVRSGELIQIGVQNRLNYHG